MSNLLLDSLEIRGFRGFQHLRIEHLGRINLIVGKNNVGKTSLLEALRIYAEKGSPTLLGKLLSTRDESQRPASEGPDLAIKYLFYGRPDSTQIPEPIKIGPAQPERQQLTLAVEWYQERRDDEGRSQLVPLSLANLGQAENPILRLTLQGAGYPKIDFALELSKSQRRWLFWKPEAKQIPNVFVSSDGLDNIRIGELWDDVALKDPQEIVITALQIIAPTIEDLHIRTDQQQGTVERTPFVRVTGIEEPIPLRSMGEGLVRILGIALALVNAKDGMLLIDEVDSGLHYSVQSAMWRLVFQTARRLNVQVFATTHSWDCIEAFQKAAVEDQQEEGVLIRLEERKGDIVAVPVSERELAIVTRDQIEVR